MIPGWRTAAGALGIGGGASAAIMLEFMHADQQKSRTGFVSKLLLQTLLQTPNWLPHIQMVEHYQLAGKACFWALTLVFPFTYCRCCCFKRGIATEMMRGKTRTEADMLMKAKVFCAKPWLNHATIMRLPKECIPDSPGEKTGSIVLLGIIKDLARTAIKYSIRLQCECIRMF